MKILYTFVAVAISAFMFFSCSTNNDPDYTLTTSTDPPAAGIVTPSHGEFNKGSEVEITATANENMVFSGWRGDFMGNENPIVMNMNSNKNIIAFFVDREYSLSIHIEGEGAVSERVLQGKSTDFSHGTIVELTANPAEGWKLVEWRGDLAGQENPDVIKMDKSREVTAVFEKREYALSINIEGEGSVSEQIIQTKSTDYEHGDLIQLTAHPAGGWVFSEWAGDLEGNENPKTIHITQETGVAAIFKPVAEVLAFTVQGEGTVDIEQIDSDDYPSKNRVRLTARPLDGWVFTEWQGDVTGSDNPVEVVLIEEIAVNAVFEIREYPLTVLTEGEGNVSEQVIQQKTTDYEEGTIVELTASPAQGWEFIEWKGDLSGSENPKQISINSPKEVTAVFAEVPEVITYNLAINIQGEGSVNIDPQQNEYDPGTVVTLTASASEGWKFDQWTGAISSTQSSDTITMDSDKSVTAIFSEKEEESTEESEETVYTLAVNIQGEGSVNISPQQNEYDPGTVVTLTASASEGWKFDQWTGAISSTQSSVTITMDSDKSVTAIFNEKEEESTEESEDTVYTLAVNIQGEGSVNIDPDQNEYEPGTIVQLTASVSEGWEFVEWTGDLSSTQPSIEITIDSDKEVTAVFAEEEGAEFFLGGNGITIHCPDAVPGETGIAGGVEYEAVDRNLLITRRDEGADLSRLCTTLVTDLSSIFARAPSFNQNIEGWDTGNVTNMQRMFDNAHTFNQDIGHWDTGNVTNTQSMFFNANSFNQDIGGWSTGNVMDMSGMFRETGTFNQDIGDWDTKNVMDMSGMFRDTGAFNQDIDDWDTKNVTDMSDMFYFAHSFNQDLEDWNTGNVTNMRRMFYGASSFNGNIDDWNTRNVTNMESMFYTASTFNGDIDDWNTRNVTNMSNMFSHASAFNQDIEDWDTQNVTNMSNMFAHASSFNGDIEDWNTGNVTTMAGMFTGATSFNQDIEDWDTRNVTDMNNLFFGAVKFDQNIGGWKTENVTSMDNMFRDAADFNQDLSGWCVTLIPDKPTNFDLNADSWALPQPEWGTCPSE